MKKKIDEYSLNQPIVPVYKKRFVLKKLKKQRMLRNIVVNERIVEIPFVLSNMHQCGDDAVILDVGCRESMLPLQLASLGYRVYGIDIREFPYTHPNFTFIKGDVCRYDFEDVRFDVVTAVSVLEHIGLESYESKVRRGNGDRLALENLHRFLKEGGTLFLTVPFGVSHTSEFQRVYDQEELDELVKGLFRFHTLECSAYRAPLDGIPFWQKVSLEEARKITSADKTNAVALCILNKD